MATIYLDGCSHSIGGLLRGNNQDLRSIRDFGFTIDGVSECAISGFAELQYFIVIPKYMRIWMGMWYFGCRNPGKYESKR